MRTTTESGAMALFECEACKKVEFRPATWKKACISGLGPAKSDPGRAHRGWERPRGRGSWRNGALGRLRVAPRRLALALAPALCFPLGLGPSMLPGVPARFPTILFIPVGGSPSPFKVALSPAGGTK
jgi:hypothetical protein